MRLQADPLVSPELQEACGDDPGYWCERFYNWTGSEAFARFASGVIDVPLRIAIIVLLAVVANRLVRRAIRRLTDRLAAERRPDAEPGWIRSAPALIAPGPPSVRAGARAQTVSALLRNVASIVIYTIAGMLVLAELNVNVAPLIASAGIAGVALGFGAQSLVRDFISGVFMMIEDQYGVGDVVDLGEASGVVENVTLRVTQLRDVNGVVWYVPNGQVLRVGNKSKQWGRVVLDIPIAYGKDVERAQSAIASVAEQLTGDEAWADKLLEPPEVWGVENLAAGAITIRVVAKTDPSTLPDLQRELRRRIVEAFDAEGIEMPHAPPYPQPPASPPPP